MSIMSRDDVHAHSEACADMGEEFQSIAIRIGKDQKQLLKYLEGQFRSFDPMAGQVAMFMATVCVRVFEQLGKNLDKVGNKHIQAAEKIVRAHTGTLLPANDEFSKRAKEVERSQPHLMDEILWALFDRSEEEKMEQEIPLSKKQSAQIYFLLWVAVEALNQRWTSAS